MMDLPKNLSLPYADYGLFKPKELAFKRIGDYVEEISEIGIKGATLRLRDGLPILITNTGENIDCISLKFKEKSSKHAYGEINEFVSAGEKSPYKWETIGKPGGQYNVLVGRKIGNLLAEDEIKEWSAKDDPLFATALELVKKKMNEHALHIFSEKPFAWERFFELQMVYLLLWSVIERYCAYAYGLVLDPNEKIKLLSQSAEFSDAVKSVSHEPIHLESVNVIHDNRNPGTWRGFDIDRMGYTMDYYYLIRSNLAHRGKSEYRDGDIVRVALIELYRIFEIILKKTLFS